MGRVDPRGGKITQIQPWAFKTRIQRFVPEKLPGGPKISGVFHPRPPLPLDTHECEMVAQKVIIPPAKAVPAKRGSFLEDLKTRVFRVHGFPSSRTEKWVDS